MSQTFTRLARQQQQQQQSGSSSHCCKAVVLPAPRKYRSVRVIYLHNDVILIRAHGYRRPHAYTAWATHMHEGRPSIIVLLNTDARATKCSNATALTASCSVASTTTGYSKTRQLMAKQAFPIWQIIVHCVGSIIAIAPMANLSRKH